jgi:hypothetical protein
MSELTDDVPARTRETLGPSPGGRALFPPGPQNPRLGAQCGNIPNSAWSLRGEITMAIWHRDNMFGRRFARSCSASRWPFARWFPLTPPVLSTYPRLLKKGGSGGLERTT